MQHQCIITIDNSQNPTTLELQTILSSEGVFDPAIPGYIAANTTSVFLLTGGDLSSASATLIWSTGAAGNNTCAIITMEFQNVLAIDNNVSLSVAAAPNNSSAALLAYGVSYFYAAQGNNNQMARDYLDSTGAHTPVYANFSVVFNSFVADQPAPNSSILPGLTNVVMLMLENRALDHLLGMLYTSDPNCVYPEGSKPPARNSTIDNPINFDGLYNNPDFSNPNPSISPETMVPVSPVTGLLNIPTPDPGEGWLNTNTQVFNSTSTEGPANMQGFVADYVNQETNTTFDVNQIMQYYTPDDLGVISTLAKSYALSDAWHASVPSQTTPNRAFSLSGTSNGYVDNSKDGKKIDIFNVLSNIVTYQSNTIFNTLNNCGLPNSWKIYYQDAVFQDSLTTHIFSQLHQFEGTNYVNSLSDFLADIANGTLPPFSYLEPAWYVSQLTGNGNDYHPPANLCPGEADLAMIYNAITKFKNWDSTLFIVTFDEHGGTFDHAVPPATIAPDDLTDWSGFQLDRLGIRIPTLLISPRIEGGMVFRSPNEIDFDHTSLIKTILGWQNIDVSGGVMGARAAQAPDFSGVLSTDVVNPGAVAIPTPVCISNEPHTLELNDLQKLVLPFLAKSLVEGKFGTAEHHKVYTELAALNSLGAVKDYVETKKKQ